MKKGTLIGLGCGLFALIILGCVGIIGGITYIGMNAYKDVTGTADQFLAKIAANDISGAYQSGGVQLRQKYTAEQFTQHAKDLGLTDYQSASWNKFNIVNSDGQIEGAMTTKSGGSVPLTISLTKEADGWKVVDITVVGITPPPKTTPKLPSEDEAKKLVLTSLTDFNKAVLEKDFKPFYATISELWKKQTTPAEIQKVFQAFIDREADLSSMLKGQFVFTEKPKITDEKNLVLTGYCTDKELKLNFTLKYIAEQSQWKLFGVNINITEN